MSPARRLLMVAALCGVAVLLAVLVLARVLDDRTVTAQPAAPQDAIGPVLLVPGYGGSTGALEVLATALRAAGREATVVPVPGDGTGDLRAATGPLAAAADAALAAGAPSVDVVGYSAGGVVARLWANDRLGDVRRVITLGSPHHGTQIAALGIAFAPGACPPACQQLAPGSDLLDELNDGDETPPGPQWLSVWTTQDEVVTPPESARLDGAVNVALQELCPGLQVDHGSLPTGPVVRALVLQAVSAEPLATPSPAVCAAG